MLGSGPGGVKALAPPRRGTYGQFIHAPCSVPPPPRHASGRCPRRGAVRGVGNALAAVAGADAGMPRRRAGAGPDAGHGPFRHLHAHLPGRGDRRDGHAGLPARIAQPGADADSGACLRAGDRGHRLPVLSPGDGVRSPDGLLFLDAGRVAGHADLRAGSRRRRARDEPCPCNPRAGDRHRRAVPADAVLRFRPDASARRAVDRGAAVNARRPRSSGPRNSSSASRSGRNIPGSPRANCASTWVRASPSR